MFVSDPPRLTELGWLLDYYATDHGSTRPPYREFQDEVMEWCRANISSDDFRHEGLAQIAFNELEDAMLCYMRFS